MILYERDGGLGALDHIVLLHRSAFTVMVCTFHVFYCFGCADVLTNNDLVAETYSQTDYKCHDTLGNQFPLFTHSFLVLPEDFDIVICKSYKEEPYGAYQKEDDVDVCQICKQ